MPRLSDDTLLQRAILVSIEGCLEKARKVIVNTGPNHESEKWELRVVQFSNLIGRKLSTFTPEERQVALEIASFATQTLRARLGMHPHAFSDDAKRFVPHFDALSRRLLELSPTE
ncbi:MAG: hypothetical protein Q8S02_09535 [Hydrogenophaga sp.]|nr:hypothetical protein [Hydrogenophaga sp.]